MHAGVTGTALCQVGLMSAPCDELTCPAAQVRLSKYYSTFDQKTRNKVRVHNLPARQGRRCCALPDAVLFCPPVLRGT